MPRRFFILLTTLFLLTSFLVFTPKTTFAKFEVPIISDLVELEETLKGIQETLDEAGGNAAQTEFCERRMGDQMNLETWYSGKCVDDSFRGEGVGFSDIIILDLIERVQGKSDPDDTLFKKLQKIIDFIGQQVVEGKSESEIKIAIVNKRSEFLGNVGGDGIIGSTGKAISYLLTNPPASTESYIADISQNLKKHHIIPTAFAANETTGYGYSGLAAFLPIWKMFRNLAYIVFVFFFIIYGFMMMFRVNISAKTVVTVQLALPKLIATLLMITFSYAIVGLMVDLMYVVFFSFISLLVSQRLIYPDHVLVNAASGQWGSIFSFIVNTFASFPASAVGIINLIIGGPGLLSAGIGIGFMYSFGLLITLILAIAIAISYIRLTWKLITAFLSIAISLVTAPVVLLTNAFPGSNTFGNWIRGIFANLSVFPITMILLTFSYILMVQPLVNVFGPTDPTSSFNIAELTFGVRNLNPGGYLMYVPFVSPPLSAIAGWMGNAPDAMLALFGVALLLMASKYVDIVRDALKVPPFKYGSAIAEPLKGGYSTLKSGYDRLVKSSEKSSAGKPAPAALTPPTVPTPPPVAPPTVPTTVTP